MMPNEYKTYEENFQDALSWAKKEPMADLEAVVRDPRPYRSWFVKAYQQELDRRKQSA